MPKTSPPGSQFAQVVAHPLAINLGDMAAERGAKQSRDASGAFPTHHRDPDFPAVTLCSNACPPSHLKDQIMLSSVPSLSECKSKKVNLSEVDLGSIPKVKAGGLANLCMHTQLIDLRYI